MSAGALRKLLGIEHPVVLAPFGGVSSVGLTATVTDAGGLGSYGLYGYGPDRIRETVTALRAATSGRFSLNLWLPTGDEALPADVDLRADASAVAAVASFFAELDLELPQPPERFLPPFDDQLDALLDARPAAVSFVFGVPAPDVVERAHARGIVAVGTATTVAEAVALADGGVDVVVATGAEAAGHRVSFLRRAEESLIGTFALVPQVVDAVDVPVIAAGGVADRRGVAAAFALGASGVQVGTAFLATRQSAASDAYRAAIASATSDASVLTRAMSGRLARGLPNRAVRVIEAAGAIALFPAQNWLTGQFRAEAARRGIGDLQSLWLGQAAGLLREDDAAAVLAELLAGVPARG
jgi:nitronate monooxygenase